MREEKEFRNPTASEFAIIEKLVTLDFPGSLELRSQLDGMLVRPFEDDDNYGSIEIKVSNGQPAHTEQRVPVQARANDTDGIAVDCLLHINEGKMSELEFFKVDGSMLKKPLRALNFTYEVRKL